MATDEQAMQQYLEREHRVPKDKAALQVGGSEFGIDGFHFDPDRRNLYLFQFRNTDSYAAFSGTSLSCPLIAGVVALLLQAHPAYSVDDVLMALRATSSQSAAPDNLLGWGVLDAVAAVDVTLGSGPEPSEGVAAGAAARRVSPH